MATELCGFAGSEQPAKTTIPGMGERTGICLHLSVRTCPFCQSTRMSRSARRGFFERVVIAFFSLRPHRCVECDRRCYSFTFLKKVPRESARQVETGQGHALDSTQPGEVLHSKTH